MKKLKLMSNIGALQEGIQESFTKSPCQDLEQAPVGSRSQSYSTLAGGFAPQMQAQEQAYPEYAAMHDTQVNLPIYRNEWVQNPTKRDAEPFHHGLESGLDTTEYREKKNMFFYIIPEGQQVLVTDKKGKGSIVKGPCRVSRWGKSFTRLQHHIAYPGEFLIIRFRDGSQSHIPGPTEQWLDPRIHSQIEKSDALQIASKESVVVYSKQETGDIHRRLITGPTVFIPKPGEWLHTFSWHGSKGEGYRKVPGGLVFQKLWMMPDQMYHDVEDVRTADDVVLKIKLMIFFELVDVQKMLEETHDPIGDFINATSSDVIDFVGRYTFDSFKSRTEQLNDTKSYSQLLGRAEQVGYKIHKIVYRGYSTTEALQQMHEQSIEKRTQLKLDRETEEQAQALSDFKQSREFQRFKEAREEEKEKELHEIEKKNLRHKQEMQILQATEKIQRDQREEEEKQRLLYQKQENEMRIDFLDELKSMGVDLTLYLTQSRADQIIEVRSDKTTPAHIHLEKKEEK
ncbi:MAG: hypothetical protein HUU50_02850 [Candidatus Brocadiae bacterium]|nr:hypothetical protein [Candidatus Brocadiia bacterium]